MTVHFTTLRPGLLVSVNTSLKGGIAYTKRDIEPDHVLKDGTKKAVWETERVIDDPAEHEAASKLRMKARAIVCGMCAKSAFGRLCPEAKSDQLRLAVADARKLCDDFNRKAKSTQVHLYVIAGRIAPDDVEAVRAINSEMRDLLAEMATGVKNLDVKIIRDAANRARGVSTMLAPEAQERAKTAIEAARAAARTIVKAGEKAAQEIDKEAIKKITAQRGAFLDLSDAPEVKAPVTRSKRKLELTPDEKPVEAKAKTKSKLDLDTPAKSVQKPTKARQAQLDL